MSMKKKNLDVYLAEVFKQFVALKDNDLKKSQEVFKNVFEQVKQKMREQCNYFNRYATQVNYAGSVYDGIKVSRLDEFDMNIIIRLPINYEDGENGIILENDQPGFIKMKIMRSFDNLDKQPDWETHHKVTRNWRDEEKYFLQSKFRHWMHSLVTRTLNEMDGQVEVNGTIYTLKYKTSGPAHTLNITAAESDPGFVVDVDVVPVVRFMLPRWPKGYRCIEGSQVKEWLVVPKPNKCQQDVKLQNRCWRLSFQEFERELMKDCQQLKTTIRLVKKLRDALGMKAIASYYIKTLFLWKIDKSGKKFWENKISVTFRTMVQELHDAVVNKTIKFYWHEKYNLIETLKSTLRILYADNLKAVLNSIDANDVEKVVSCLLTANELAEFKKSKFYQSQTLLTSSSVLNSSTTLPKVCRQESIVSNSATLDTGMDNQEQANLWGVIKNFTEKVDMLTDNIGSLNDKLDSLTDKVDSLTDKVTFLDHKVKQLEMEKNSKAAGDLNGLSFGFNAISVVDNKNEQESNSDDAVAALIPMCKTDIASESDFLIV